MISAILAVLHSLPVYKDDRDDPRKSDQLVMVAEAVEYAAQLPGWRGSRNELRGLLITIAYHESGFALRIHAGACRRYECDGGRAAGLWQMHPTAWNRSDWNGFVGLDAPSTRLAALHAARALISARRMCDSAPDPILATINAYAGRGCSITGWTGAATREVTYRRIMRELGKNRHESG